eukprot:220658-Rhodomonas_salina.1
MRCKRPEIKESRPETKLRLPETAAVRQHTSHQNPPVSTRTRTLLFLLVQVYPKESYAKSSDEGCAAMQLPPYYAVSGTDPAYAATRTCCDMSGTDLGMLLCNVRH